MYNLPALTYQEASECRAAVHRLLADEPGTMSEAADRIVRFIYDNFGDGSADRACALVRTFKTHRYSDLTPDLQTIARSQVSPDDINDEMRCLVLLATAGQEAEWNSPATSRHYRCIPLASENMVEGAPMIAQLIKQIGIAVSAVVRPDPTLMLDQYTTTYNIFYVAQAAGSPFIVAQDEFVRAYAIESVVGFGGLVASGDLLATVLFSKVAISPDVADLFRGIGLAARITMLSSLSKPLFPR